ncbi:hypothetical protein AMS68_003083 [Peltaster fructicola]|uniref:Uncharacterized protein n=1 Tax=Peltaster fructicola TaxID=286661 RepID=A0A6H0XSA0_9PEZI|nr:hypothetical protein AMS68_003083 [Peltaster fructicola]
MDSKQSQMAAVGWRQAQPDARISPRASAQHLVTSGKSTSSSPTFASSTTHTQTPIATTNSVDAKCTGDVRRAERPSLLTEASPTRYAGRSCQSSNAERSLISPHTPSTEQWQASSVDDHNGSELRSIKVSPRHRSSFLSAARQSMVRSSIPPSAHIERHEKDERYTSAFAANPPMSLPSFAAFSDAAQARQSAVFPATLTAGQAKGVASCLCAHLSPIVQIAADAARRLSLALRDHILQLNETFSHTIEPQVQLMQNLVEQLLSAEKEFTLAQSAPPQRSVCTKCHATLTTSDRSPVNLKRYADGDTSESLKRLRVDTHSHQRSSPPAPLSRADSREDAYRSSSPSAMRSGDLAQPIPRSGAQNRLLPSPSSLVQPPVTFATGSTIGSPSTASYPHSGSLHNASTSSVASQHIANLEHKVSLTSLSLQSLQDEHTSLLKKWHRERTKIQTIEKKCQISDSEINELSARNEELLEQVKTLELQLLDTGRKREDELRLAARDKDQWSRMLEMSRRMQADAEMKSQRFQHDKSRLEERVLWFEQTNGRSAKETPTSAGTTDIRPDAQHDQQSKQDDRSSHTVHASTRLRDKTIAMQRQIDELRAALEDAQRRNISMDEKFGELITHRQALSQVLHDALSCSKKVTTTEAEPVKSQAGTSLEDRQGARSIDITPQVMIPAAPQSTSTVAERSAAAASVEAFLNGDPVMQIGLNFSQSATTYTPEEICSALGKPSPSVAKQ